MKDFITNEKRLFQSMEAMLQSASDVVHKGRNMGKIIDSTQAWLQYGSNTNNPTPWAVGAGISTERLAAAL